jgi:hypothetical protein
MAKKKEEDEVPEGIKDEDGDEVINLYNEHDDLDEEVEGEDIYEIEDEMLADTTEEEEWGPERDEKIQMLRDIYCSSCKGSSTKKRCNVRDDFGCPPDKADK